MIFLKEIARIDTGRTFRQKMVSEPSGDCLVIQIKDLSANDLSIGKVDVLMNSNNFSDNHLLNKGDILFVAKGNTNYAVQYNLAKKATAVSLFFIIRTSSPKVLSEYLTWYLNAPLAQSYFHEHRSGGSVGNIKKADLENLPIQLPSLAIQKKITQLHQLFKHEQQLNKEYLSQKEKYLNGIFNNLIK